MQMLLITLVGPQKRLDLQVPGEMLLSDLLPPLLELCVSEGIPASRETQHTMWQLLHQQVPLSLDRSLIDAEVVDGALLMLQNQEEQMTQPLPPTKPTSQHFTSRAVTPGRSTGGIGVTWSSEGLANDE